MSAPRFSCRACRPVLFRHDDGWDVYPRSECYRAPDGSWVPAWFDSPIVESAPSRVAAVREWATWHPGLGYCSVAHVFA